MTTQRIRKGATVLLLDHEVRLCWQMARERIAQNKKANVKDMKFSSRSSEEINARGIMGEMALFKFLKMDYNATLRDTTPRNVMSDTGDCVLPNGETFDCKTVARRNLPLLIHSRKQRNPMDYYVLMMIEDGIAENGILSVMFEGAVTGRYAFESANYREHIPAMRNQSGYFINNNALTELQVDMSD
jgi:hypothetical protein